MTKLMMVLAAVALTRAAQAQTIAAGDIVRLSAPALGVSKEKFRFVGADSDSVHVASTGGAHDTSAMARSAITSLEVNHAGARHGHAGTGIVIGGLIGGLTGLLYEATDHELSCAIAAIGNETCPSGHEVSGFLAGFAIGGAVGGLIGLAIRSPTWTKADPAAVTTAPRVAILPTWTPSTRAVGFAAHVRF